MSKPHIGERTPLSVSQNFLTSSGLIRILLGKTSLNREDRIIEIGPGKGHITAQLLARCKTVTAVEFDARLHGRLCERFGECPGLELVHMDFMRFALPQSGAYKVFGHIPFHRTTDILRKLTECENPPSEAWLTMEKGAAMRFLGLPRESLRSLMLKPVCEMKIVHRFSREDFHPAPGVDVVLVRLKKKARPDIAPVMMRKYEAFVRAALSARTKSRRDASGETRYIQWLCLFRRRYTGR